MLEELFRLEYSRTRLRYGGNDGSEMRSWEKWQNMTGKSKSDQGHRKCRRIRKEDVPSRTRYRHAKTRQRPGRQVGKALTNRCPILPNRSNGKRELQCPKRGWTTVIVRKDTKLFCTTFQNDITLLHWSTLTRNLPNTSETTVNYCETQNDYQASPKRCETNAQTPAAVRNWRSLLP